MDKKNNKILLKNIKSNKNKKIIFWGASLFLENFINSNNLKEYKILGIADINAGRWGENIGDYKILNPETIPDLKAECIIITINNVNKDKNKSISEYIRKKFPNIKLLPNKLKPEKTNYYKLAKLYKFLDVFIPKNKKKILFISYPDFSDNAKAYYDYLIENHENEYELNWLYEDIKNLRYAPIKNKFHISNFKGIWHLLTSKYIVCTHLTLDNICDFKKHKCLQLWHGMPLKTLGSTEKNIDKNTLKKYQEHGEKCYFFVSSDIFKVSMISCFLMNSNRIFITGQSKTDCILSDRNKQKIESLINIEKYNKVVIYAPTYKETIRNNQRDIDKPFENIFYFEDYSKSDFYKMLEEKNILFIIKPHPLDESFYKKLVKNEDLKHSNIKVFFDEDMKINDVYFYDFFKSADLMITDFSSIAIDYLISKKPVIFLNSLSNEYSKNRGFILEDNYEVLMPGAKVNCFEKLLLEIENALTIDSWKEKRIEKLPLLYKYFDNKSSERIYEKMKEL